MSRTWGPSILIGILLVLFVATIFVFVDDVASQKHQDEQAEQIQRMLGGLGFGPAVDLAECPFSFDPRLGCRCAADQGPIPGGTWFCPRHSCSVFYYAPLDNVSDSSSRESESVETSNAHSKIP